MSPTLSSTACPFAGDSTSFPDAARLLPVVTCLSVSSGTTLASTTSCMLLNRERSFNSMKVTPLESRRERTQPRNVTSVPTGSEYACLTEKYCELMGPSIQQWAEMSTETKEDNSSVRIVIYF